MFTRFWFHCVFYFDHDIFKVNFIQSCESEFSGFRTYYCAKPEIAEQPSNNNSRKSCIYPQKILSTLTCVYVWHHWGRCWCSGPVYKTHQSTWPTVLLFLTSVKLPVGMSNIWIFKNTKYQPNRFSFLPNTKYQIAGFWSGLAQFDSIVFVLFDLFKFGLALVVAGLARLENFLLVENAQIETDQLVGYTL